MAPIVWLAFYLLAGLLVLWACYRSGSCRLDSRLSRNLFLVARLPFGRHLPEDGYRVSVAAPRVRVQG